MKKNILLLALFFFLFQQCDSKPVIPAEEEKPTENVIPDDSEEPGDTDESDDTGDAEEPEVPGVWESAAEINARLGRGINIGNTYEAEQSWQSPFDPADLKRIADLGFTHVRLPIRWERGDRSLATSPYTITPAFLKVIQAAVDEALKQKLHIILNMHHHDALMANPAGEKARFLSQWEQIADHFKAYPDSLLFEILNEPHDQLIPTLWNGYLSEALQVIRTTNPKRCVLIGTAEWGGVGGLPSLQFPDDPQLILTLHYYNPHTFTHQGASWSEGSDAWLGTQWHDTQFERQAVEQDFKAALRLSVEKQFPIHIGEFGAYSRADLDSRVRWTRFLARWFEQQGFSWAYWEWNSGFGIYNPQSGQYEERLVNALTSDPMTEPYEPDYVNLYSSNFANGQSDGWTLTNNDASAASTMAVANNKLTVTVTKPGTVNWHIQLIKAGMSIEKGKTYRVAFNASSPDSDERRITVDVSRNSDPWTGYGSQSVTIDKNHSPYNLLFTSAHTDSQARIVFSLGNAGNTRVVLSDIKLMEVQFE